MKASQTVLSSRIRLARNYEDLPFDVAEKPDLAQKCVARTRNALKLAGADEGFSLIYLRDAGDTERRAMAERRLISGDLLRHPDTAAVLLREDEALSIMMNEEDHLRIQAIMPGMDLVKAAEVCFRTEDALSRHVTFAFDRRWGYLTSCPTNTGTGMRASLMMHLPMLTALKRMGDVGSIAAKAGLTIRGVYGEGQEALGHVYQVSNQVTLGRTEQELIATVNAVGQQLANMELALRAKSLAERRTAIEDAVFRAWGTMTSARLMGLDEFYGLWSSARLGAAMGMLVIPVDTLDELLTEVQDNNLRAWAENPLEDDAMKEVRATRIRLALGA